MPLLHLGANAVYDPVVDLRQGLQHRGNPFEELSTLVGRQRHAGAQDLGHLISDRASGCGFIGR